MKIEAHRCNYCGKIAIAVDGRRLTEHRHHDIPADLATRLYWTIVESIDFYSDTIPRQPTDGNVVLAGLLGGFLAESIRPYLDKMGKVHALQAPAAKSKARVRANHLRVVPAKTETESKPPLKKR